ncbi:hypothetical protein TSAR_016749, partial [Trichomalopsis sarcophagae]
MEADCENSVQEKVTKETYFDIVKKEEGKDKHATCKTCKRNIPMEGGNTTALKSHLKSCNYKGFEKMYQNEKKSVPSNQKTMDSFKTPQNQKVNWERFRSCWIAYKNLPINFFDDDLTQKMFSQLNPLRISMRNEIMKEFPKMESNLIKILHKNDSKFSFTVDAATFKNNCSYYGIRIHFIDNNFVMQAVGLDLVASDSKYAGKIIVDFFYSTIVRYGILHKVQGITDDNVASNTTFINQLGDENSEEEENISESLLKLRAL